MDNELIEPKRSSPALTTLEVEKISEIKCLHENMMQLAKDAGKKGLQIGTLLVELRRKVGHGNWESYVESNLPFSVRTARNYLALAKHQLPGKSANVADLDLAGELRRSQRRTTGPSRQATGAKQLRQGEQSARRPPEHVVDAELSDDTTTETNPTGNSAGPAGNLRLDPTSLPVFLAKAGSGAEPATSKAPVLIQESLACHSSAPTITSAGETVQLDVQAARHSGDLLHSDNTPTDWSSVPDSLLPRHLLLQSVQRHAASNENAPPDIHVEKAAFMCGMVFNHHLGPLPHQEGRRTARRVIEALCKVLGDFESMPSTPAN